MPLKVNIDDDACSTMYFDGFFSPFWEVLSSVKECVRSQWLEIGNGICEVSWQKTDVMMILVTEGAFNLSVFIESLQFKIST